MNTEIIVKVIDSMGQYIIDTVENRGILEDCAVNNYANLIEARLKCNIMQDATEMVQKIAREHGL